MSRHETPILLRPGRYWRGPLAVFALGALVIIAGCDSGDPEEEPDPPSDGEARTCAGEYPCRNVDLVAHLSIAALGGGGGTELNDVWGWTDPQTGRQYALVGRTDGTAFVDVTDPGNPVYLGSLPTATTASSWRDIKVKNDHAFVIADNAGAHGMQIFDLAQLRSASGGDPQTFAATAVYEGFGSAHNVVTAGEGTARAYGVGTTGGQDVPQGTNCGAGYHGVDLSDPADPQFAGCFNSSLGGIAAPGYTHDAQCVTYHGPDSEHQGREICIGADETGISVADLTDLDAPQQLATGTYPRTGYTHQGWFGPDQRYFYLDDELDERNGLVSHTRTLLWDMEDLDAPVLVTQHTGATTSIDHNQYVVGDRLYQANYTSGLRILDVSDPAQPQEVGFFDVYPANDNPTFDGAWSVYPFFEDGPLLVSGIGSGLFLLEATGEAAR